MLGLGPAAASVVQVTTGLRSLDRTGGANLTRVRAGEANRLALPLPDVSKLRPLRTKSMLP